MKRLILLFGVLFSISNFAQTKKDSLISLNASKLVSESAVFPEGNEQFGKILANKIRTKKLSGSGIIKTEITFVVEKDGSLSNIKTYGENPEFNNEAIKATSKIKKKWKPAIHNGNLVRSRYKIPLTMKFNN